MTLGQKVRVVNHPEEPQHKCIDGRTGTITRLLRSDPFGAWVDIDGDPIPDSVRCFSVNDPHGRGNHIKLQFDQLEAVRVERASR